MAVSATAKSLTNADSYSTKWHTKRIHRKLDDRDDVLDEALQIIESHDTAALPYISGFSGALNYNSVSQTSGTALLTIAIAGSGCTATSTVTCILGTESIAPASINPGTNSVQVTMPDMGDWGTTPADGDLVPVYLRIDGVLCPVITFECIA